MTESELLTILKRHLRVEVVNSDAGWTLNWPLYPEVRVRLLWGDVVISEDTATFIHDHGGQL